MCVDRIKDFIEKFVYVPVDEGFDDVENNAQPCNKYMDQIVRIFPQFESYILISRLQALLRETLSGSFVVDLDDVSKVGLVTYLVTVYNHLTSISFCVV